MKKFSLGVTVETLLNSMGHVIELDKTIQLHIYADYGDMEDEIFFHEGRLIMHVTEGTVIHASVDDVTKSVQVVSAGDEGFFKLEFADFKPYTSDEQGVIQCPLDKVPFFEADWAMITGKKPGGEVVERDVASVSPKLS